MKTLKKFLMLFLISFFFCFSNVKADENDFNNILGYFNTKSNSNLIYNPVDNKSNNVIYSYIDKPNFILNVTGQNATTVPNGQILLYVNTCWNLIMSEIPSNSNFVIKSISNNIGTVNELVQIGYTVEENKCNFSPTWKGNLVRVVYSLSYNFERDNTGTYSFLDSDISMNYDNLDLLANTTTKYVNVFISKYDENVVNSIKQQQISDKTNTYLQQQIDKQQQTNDKLDDVKDKIKDTNDTIKSDNVSGANTTAKNFFDNFTTTNHGGISSIVSAPLTAVNAMLNGTCTPLTATYKNKTIEFPCGNDFWDKMSEVKTFLNVVEGGILCYCIIISLYKDIEKLKNPDDDRVDVMNL